MAIRKELLDELLKEYKNHEDIFGKNGIPNELKKAIMERALAGELTHHLGYKKRSPQGKNSGNSRNGKSSKRVKTESGEVEIEIRARSVLYAFGGYGAYYGEKENLDIQP